MAQISEDRKAILKAELDAWHNGTTGPLKDYGAGSINNGRKGWLPPTAGEPTGTWEANTPWFDIDGEADYTALVEAPRGRLLFWRNNIGGAGQGSATEDSTNPFGMDAARFNVLKAGAGYPWAWSWTTVDSSVGTQMVDDTWFFDQQGTSLPNSIDDDTLLNLGGPELNSEVKDIWSTTFHDGTADHRTIIRQSNVTFGFTANSPIDGYDSEHLHYSSNSGYGVLMRHWDIDSDGKLDSDIAVTNAQNHSWWDITEEHMATANGDSLRSGPLDSSVVSRLASNTSGHEIGSGHLVTIVYSGANVGASLTLGPNLHHALYYTQNSYSINAYDPTHPTLYRRESDGSYSASIRAESVNIEGDIAYVTYNLEGSFANAWNHTTHSGLEIGVNSQIPWDDENSDPRIFEEYQDGTAGRESNTGFSRTLRGMIIWNANTAPGNTNINFPIRINPHVGFPGYHS